MVNWTYDFRRQNHHWKVTSWGTEFIWSDHTLLEKANNNGEKKRIVYDFLRGHTHTHQFWNLKDTPNGFVLYCLTYLLLFLSGACGSLYMTHVVNKLQPSKHPFKQVQPGTLPALHSFWGPLFHSKKWI